MMMSQNIKASEVTSYANYLSGGAGMATTNYGCTLGSMENSQRYTSMGISSGGTGGEPHINTIVKKQELKDKIMRNLSQKQKDKANAAKTQQVNFENSDLVHEVNDGLISQRHQYKQQQQQVQNYDTQSSIRRLQNSKSDKNLDSAASFTKRYLNAQSIVGKYIE